MTAWYALWRPGGKEPEGVDFCKTDLWSLALRRNKFSDYSMGRVYDLKSNPGRSADGRLRSPALITRDAAIKRLRRKGWCLERLPERFWEKARRWEDLQEKEAAFDRAIRRSLGL